MAQTIVIKKEYFDNIRTAIDSMNKFFESNFKTKSFPVVNNDFQLDRILARTLSWLNNVEPSWVANPKNAEAALQNLRSLVEGEAPAGEPEEAKLPEGDEPAEEEVTKEADESAAVEGEEKAAPEQQSAETPETPDMELGEADPAIDSAWAKVMDGTDKAATDTFHHFIGFKMLQFITDNFNEFDNLLKGIYSFELFTTPSKFRSAIELFTSPLDVPELTDISPLPGEYKLFTPEDYVSSIFDNDQIKLPDDMMEATETARFAAFTDLTDTEIQVDDISDKNDTVQEAAEVNYFDDFKAHDIKYNPSSKKFVISKQYESVVNKFISAVRKCETVDDLAKLFSKEPQPVDWFTINTQPAILIRAFNNIKKYPFDTYDVDATFKYVKSYKSIVKQNTGARRYERIDIFSTFKTNREATIKFLEDFLKLNLVNSNRPIIGDKTLLTVFNIFDSHIYYTILYNLISKPDQTADEFIKAARKKVNDSTKSANPYQKNAPTDGKVRTSKQVQESVMETMRELGDMTIVDTQYCDAFAEAVYDDISTLGDDLYNNGVSVRVVDQFIGESYDLFAQEAAETGDIPDYMKDRIAISDADPDKKPTTVTDVEVPPETPENDIDDLGDSIDARCDHEGDELGDSFGAGYNGQVLPPSKGGPGHVVYNITNNYSNSHNTTTTTTNTSTNDLSSGKTITNKNVTNNSTSNVTNANDSSSNKTTITGAQQKPTTNNYDNTSTPANSKDSDNTFSNGKSVQEVFALLNSSEPLFVEGDAGEPPKTDVLTTVTNDRLDKDRETLAKQQEAKRGVQKIGNAIKAAVKPVTRAKSWLRSVADSFIKRDENAIKADILDNKSYRSAMYKACRIAIKGGKFALFSAISPWFGLIYAGKLGFDIADRERLRKEVASEVAVELQIMDKKIEALEAKNRYGEASLEQRQELYKMMRMRQKLADMAVDSKKHIVHNTKSVY
ncbi:MAG: hypothetical protein J5614_04410 [Paludibacteraceae bacterium]|nr:hypothetical protein [Paludibacteraceae bacterium]